MLLSDRDLRAEITAGRVCLGPYDPGLVQPSSVDLRLDRDFTRAAVPPVADQT